MLIPMEMLSTMTTRADSGSGVRQRSDSGTNSNGFNFGTMFQNEMQKSESRKQFNTSTQPINESSEPVISYEKDEIDKITGEEFAAGVMGNQQLEVVFILEGDSEAVIINNTHADNNVEPPVPVEAAEIEPEPKAETLATDIESKPFELNLQLETAKTNVTLTGAEVKNTEHVIETEDATAKLAELGDTANASEAAARMPDMRTRDSQDYSNHENQESINGNLSPLENENEQSQVAGQSDYEQAADAARNAEPAQRAEDTLNTENNTENVEQPSINEIAPPLSEGIKTEQFIANQQIKSEAMYAPVKTENLFEEMISRVQTMQTDNVSTMKIQLNPEWLGNVALEVGLDAQGLHVKINAEDSGVRGMINGQIAALIESLEEKGLEVAKVEVINTSVAYDATKDPHESHEKRDQSRHQRFHREVDSKDGVALYTTVSEVHEYYLDAGVSSVEYSA